MPRIFECVPNVSEGRDAATLDACAAAIEAAGVELAHRTSDVAHNRSVFTFFGTRERVLDAALGLARVAAARIDLRAHDGVHPRIGVLDVLPFVPFGDATMRDAVAVAHAAAARLWDELAIPSYFYDAAAHRTDAAGAHRDDDGTDPGAPWTPSPEATTRTLPQARRGGFEGLSERADRPDVGRAFHPSAGAVAVGARTPLVAFNVVLASDDLALARRIARTIRERDGGLRALRALGLRQTDGRVQVSCNLTDVAATPIAVVVECVRALARPAGVAIAGTETIGLVPRAALADVVRRALGCDAQPGGGGDGGGADTGDIAAAVPNISFHCGS